MSYNIVGGNFTGLYVDEHIYTVGLVYQSLQRSFDLVEGNNSGTAISGKAIRDLIGTKYSYSLELVPLEGYYSDYYKLYNVLAAAQDYHTIRLPYGDSFMEFLAIITIESDKYLGSVNGVNEWSHMKLQIDAAECQRIPSN